MKYFIFRNSTIENLLGNTEFTYSGYDNIETVQLNADVLVWFYVTPIETSSALTVSKVESYFNKIQFIYKQIPLDKTFIIFTLQPINVQKYKKNDFSIEKAISHFNEQIIDFSNEHRNVKIIDFSDFTNNYSSEQLIDWKYYFISYMQINPRLAKPFRKWFFKQIDAIQLKRKKCLVLDLDNTIWGGILGEDGINGIKTGGDYPGNAFEMFQKYLIELSKTGIILAICSKNNEQDVLEVWEKNPYLKLRKEHISAYRINWNSKVQNLKELSQELNISLDSFVFVDDNPAERELVKQLLPMVEVPDFPEEAYKLPPFFTTLQENYFSIYDLTEEDKTKAEQYKTNSIRNNLVKDFAEFTDYLASLEMILTIQQANSINLSRIAQLTQKTNQFNLTTLRYSDVDLLGFLDRNDQIYCLSVKDKFGDYGITGVIILKKNTGDTVEIDSLLLSCRVLGKDIECAFVSYILELLKLEGIKTVFAKYIPTIKNSQTNDFYDKIGFSVVSQQDDIKNYSIDLQQVNLSIASYYKIEQQ